MLLTFTINKQLIKRTDCEIPVAKSENYLYAQFSFSDEWVGTKTAIFNNGTPYSVILDEDNKCLVPWEVITASGFSVSVFCGQRITANVEFVKVLPTGYIEGQTPEPPTPSVYDQIIEELNSKQDELIAGENITINGNVISASGGGGGGTTDYEDLENKPSINDIEIVGDLSLDDLGIMGKPLIFTNQAPVFTDQSANPDSGYENYTYKGVISNLEGVTADMLATVIFSEAQAISGNYAITCVTGAKTVTIYSNDNSAITIPTIIVGTPINYENNAEVEAAMDEIIGGVING